MQQRMPKVEHFATLGLWCDLWLGSLFYSIWSFIDLRSQSWGLGKIRHSERSQENQRTVLCCVFSTDFRGKGVHFLQKPLTEPRNLKKVQPSPPKMPRSFWFFPVGEVWQPQMNFSSFGSLGCEIKGASRDSHVLTIITTCFQQKTSLNKDDQKHTPNQHAGECHYDRAITLFKGNMDI